MALVALLLGIGAAGFIWMAPLVSAQTVHEWTVSSSDDSGAGTLRDAIDSANASSGGDRIVFASAMVIRPQRALPPLIDEDITIDAAFGAASTDTTPAVWLDGSQAGDAAGIEVDASGAVIRGLGIGGFERYGIGLIGEGVDGARIEGNWIGWSGQGGTSGNDLSGVAVLAGATGVKVVGNRIGGNSSPGRTGHGIVVGGNGSHADISGNVIGIAADGSSAPNDDGILVVDRAYAEVRGNVIGYSKVAGIELRDSWLISNIDSNRIGVLASGRLAPNDVGVFLGPGSSGAQVGLGGANVIAGNRVGIAVEQLAREAWIQNNWVGLVPSGANAEPTVTALPLALSRPNRERGLSIIAGAAKISVRNNVVSAGEFGIVVADPHTTLISLSGNVVAGSRQDRTEAAIDIRAGIEISVGGDRGAGNHVCGAEFGIRIAETEEPQLHHNAVGAGVATRVTFDSDDKMTWGIRLDDGVIGARVEDNVIADASRAAVSVVGDRSQDNLLLRNRFLNNASDIDLGADGIDSNDAGDRDRGPNGRLNRPQIEEQSVRRINDQQLRSTFRGTATPGSYVEIYVDDGEGTSRLARSGRTDRSGNWSARSPVTPSGAVRALAYESSGATSEFSDWIVPAQRLRLGPGVNWFGWTGPDQEVGAALQGIERWLETVWVWRPDVGWRGWSPYAAPTMGLSMLRSGDVVRVELSERTRSVELFVSGGVPLTRFDAIDLREGYNSVTWFGGAVERLAQADAQMPGLISRVWQWDGSDWRIIWPRLQGAWQSTDQSVPVLWIAAIRDGVLALP